MIMKNAVFWDVASCFGLVKPTFRRNVFASIFRVERISELGTMLAVTNRPYYC
jgi:hypothetical protein